MPDWRGIEIIREIADLLHIGQPNVEHHPDSVKKKRLSFALKAQGLSDI